MRCGLARELLIDHHELILAPNGAALIERLTQVEPNAWPDVVITDNHMPGASGLDVLRFIRSRAKAIPVLLMSGLCDDALLRDAAKLGATCVFHKPFHVADLRTALRCILFRRAF